MNYFEAAAQLQSMTRESESMKDQEFTESELRRAIMYARQDIVLLVSLSMSLNKQMSTIRLLLGMLVVMVAAILLVR